MATEYIFFDEGLRDRFVKFAEEHHLACELRKDDMEGFVVALPDQLDDADTEALEDLYEELMDEQMALVESAEEGDARDVLGVSVPLADGRSCIVRLPADLGRRLFQHFSADEIHALVAGIAESVENPVVGPLCRSG